MLSQNLEPQENRQNGMIAIISEMCKRILTKTHDWIKSQDCPPPASIFWGIILVMGCAVSMRAMYSMLQEALKFLFPNPNPHIAFATCFFGALSGVMLHTTKGKFRILAGIVVCLLIVVLCSAAYFQMEALLQIGNDEPIQKTAVQVAAQTPIEEPASFSRPLASAFYIGLLSFAEFACAWGAIHLLGGSVAYLFLVPLAPIALLYCITNVLQHKKSEEPNSEIPPEIPKTPEEREQVEKQREEETKYQEWFLESSPQRMEFLQQRHLEWVEKERRQQEARLLQIHHEYEVKIAIAVKRSNLKMERMVLFVLRWKAFFKAFKANDTAEAMKDTIYENAMEDLNEKHRSATKPQYMHQRSNGKAQQGTSMTEEQDHEPIAG